MASGCVGSALNCLPEDILVEVFFYLPVRDLLRISRVSKKWRRLISDKRLWKDVDLTPYKMNSKTLWHLLRRYFSSSLRSLKVRGCLHSVKKQEVLTEAWLSELGKRCSGISHLHITEMDLRTLSCRCLPTSLTRLEIAHSEISVNWFSEATKPGKCSAPKLTSLILRNVPAFSDHHLQNLSPRHPLKTLVLSGTYRVTDKGIEALATSCKEIVHLKLHRCQISDSALHFVGRHLKQLHSLNLTNIPALTDAGLTCLASLKKLESLNLKYCCQLSAGGITFVCKQLPSLKYLNLDGIALEEHTLQNIRHSLSSCTVSNSFPDMDAVPKP
ncbi:F-box/LRR-repeat protein 12-like [Protopterus annectens]|uniref:F-box/LRR-repeat protein 12-like n=1 Tax=Protopterus annectens TaxID=7888 RepID=UPI001CFA7074|nr:F-box/LRR-repeat protein 12-like [Protopterus annectens]